MGSGRKGNHGLNYHLYLIPEDLHLKNYVAFTYEDRLQREVRNKREALLRDVGPLYMSADKEVADNDMSRNTVGVEMTED